MLDKIRNWYNGEFVFYENEPNSRVFIIGGDYRRHWTATFTRVVVEFWLAEWKWIIGTAIAVIALFMTYLKLG